MMFSTALRRWIKRFLLSRKHIVLDPKSEVNFSVVGTGSRKYPVRIVETEASLVSVGEGSFLNRAFAFGKVEVGRFVSINGPGTVLHGEIYPVVVGSFSSIAPNVVIYSFNHVTSRPSTFAFGVGVFGEAFEDDIESKGPTILEEDVWVGANTAILSGVTIGRGSIIGAGSVVTKSLPRYSIAFGNPARVQRLRFDDKTIEELESLRWWDWTAQEIGARKDFFHRKMGRESHGG